MTWTQVYDPLHNTFVSTLLAALPVVVLLGSIALLKVRIHYAALVGLGVALAVAVFVYGMPARMAGATTLYGAAFGLFPIGWIILNLIFLYQLTVDKGWFAVLRGSLGAIAPDPRVQVILIAFSFGAFFEGAAGFGTPVAVTSAILMQLGFKPLQACGLSLIANTAPVAFGALGTPIIALSKVTGFDELTLSKMVGRQLPFFSVLVPFWVVWAQAGWRGMLGVWPAALVAGVAFAVPQFLVSNFHGPWLVDIVAALCSIGAVVLLLKFWQPRDASLALHEPALARSPAFRRQDDRPAKAGTPCQPPPFMAPMRDLEIEEAAREPERQAPARPDETPRVRAEREVGAPISGQVSKARISSGECLLPKKEEREKALADPKSETRNPKSEIAEVRRAWVPWILLSLLVFLWGTPQLKNLFDGKMTPKETAATLKLNLPDLTDGARLRPGITAPEFPVAGLHNLILRTNPVVSLPTPGKPTKPEEAVFKLNWLSATGTGILFAAMLAGFYMGFSIRDLAAAYARTVWRVRFSLVTIAAMLALGYVTRYSGTDATLGLALAKTGKFYPFFGTLLGWLGVALTGSDTASNVLFGSLQKITAEQTGISPHLMAAANSSGGVMGKMVDAQSIVVASTATNWYGHEGAILRYVFFHSIALAALVGLLVYLQAYVLPFTQMVVK
ncbi:MAG TPA: L-lactate permease [Verrucomicrobiae bacterium]|nr:L-lactate permease [Verrucomicrobiae bacterium]